MKNDIEVLWTDADAAWDRGIQAYLDWCVAVKKIYDAGGATQEQIGERYEIGPRQRIVDALAIATDQRLERLTFENKIVAKDKHALYLLTTLDDKGFEELAKPGVTQAKILEYKRRLKAPEPTVVVTSGPTIMQRPPCPGKEGGKAGDWHWNTVQNCWSQRIGFSGTTDAIVPVTQEMSISEAEAIMGIMPMPREVLQAIFRYQASANHPDKGGSDEKMALINKAYERLQNDYY